MYFLARGKDMFIRIQNVKFMLNIIERRTSGALNDFENQ